VKAALNGMDFLDGARVIEDRLNQKGLALGNVVAGLSLCLSVCSPLCFFSSSYLCVVILVVIQRRVRRRFIPFNTLYWPRSANSLTSSPPIMTN
jgi:hypothetical protein